MLANAFAATNRRKMLPSRQFAGLNTLTAFSRCSTGYVGAITTLRPSRLASSFDSPRSSRSNSFTTPYWSSSRRTLPHNTVVKFVPQQEAWVVERMGKFHRVLEPGLAILVPFLDRIKYVKTLKEQAIEIPSQSAITQDNVTLMLGKCRFSSL